MQVLFSSIFVLLMAFLACNKNEKASVAKAIAHYDSVPIAKSVPKDIDETSGIADSKANKGYLWLHEDSGNPPELSLLGHDGNFLKKVYIKGVENRDWEDIVLAGDKLYIADIGDNIKQHKKYTIYQFTEPSSAIDTVTNTKAIHFIYPDGQHDAEAFLVDPQTKDIFIITKSDNPSRVYQLTYPYSTDSVNTVTYAGELKYREVVGAALSPDGKEIIVKTYSTLYHYLRNEGESIAQALQKKYITLPYRLELQGEAVTFSNANNGYFTLGESFLGSVIKLYFYKRL